MWEWLTDYSFLMVLMGVSLVGLFSGVFGSFVVLRQQSLLGDAIAHAALPGIALAFFLFQVKASWVLLLGAMLTGVLGALLIACVVNFSYLKEDAALGIILSVFFGFGIFLLSIMQRMPTAQKAGLKSYLFGSAATLLRQDVFFMAGLGVMVCIPLFLFWKEWKLMVFDRDYARAMGVPVFMLDCLLIGFVVVVIVLGLQTVGVVLMSAMLIAPAVAARQWTESLGKMVFLSALFGWIASVLGTFTSSAFEHMPTGPVIVVVISVIVGISLLGAPKRGVMWDWGRQFLKQRNIRAQAMLANMLLFTEVKSQPFHAHDIAALTAIGRGPARRALRLLLTQGFVANPEGDMFHLTPDGLDEAKRLKLGGLS